MPLPVRRSQVLIAQLATFIALATVGAKWFLVARFGGRAIEASNFGGLIVLGLGALVVLSSRQLRSNSVFNTLLLLQALLLVMLSLRGDPVTIVIMSIANTLVAYALVNAGTLRAPGVIIVAFTGLLGFIVMSAAIAGIDLLGGVVEYMQTLNRDRFKFHVLRPIYNAFTSGPEVEEYTTTINNALAATFALFYVLSGSYAVCGNRRMAVVAVISLAAVFTIFSSSAMLVCGTMTIVFAAAAARRARSSIWWLYALFVGLVGLSSIVTLFGAEYLVENIVSDDASRQGRLLQYEGALAAIDANFWLGAGVISVHGHYVHNLFLFAFSAIGIVGAILVLAVFVMAAGISFYGLRRSFLGPDLQPQTLMAAGLPLIFMIRSLVGGAGGLPNGPGILALALAVIAFNEVRAGDRLRTGSYGQQPGLTPRAELTAR